MSRRRRFTLLPLLLVGAFVLYQYFSAEKVTNPETGRSARVALSSDQEKALGVQAYREVLAQADTITSGAEYELVCRVAEGLGPATGEAAKDFEWDVSLVRSADVNAFCLPGGKIVVYTGILAVAQTEAGLAAVMGHEMAHAVARHGSQRLLRNELSQSVLVGVGLSLGDMDYQQRQMVMAAPGAGATYGLILPFSRNHETEADEMGLLHGASRLRSRGGDCILGAHERNRWRATARVCVHASRPCGTHRGSARASSQGE